MALSTQLQRIALVLFSLIFTVALANGSDSKVDKETWYEMQFWDSKGQSPQALIRGQEEPRVFNRKRVVSSTTNAVAYEGFYNEERESQFLVGLQGGLFEYPEVANSTSINPATGLKLGWMSASGFVSTIDFLYSFQKTEINRLTQTDTEHVDHYMATLGLGYNWMRLVRPQWNRFSLQTDIVGSHSWRQYNQDENASKAWDLGGRLIAGYKVTTKIQLALEYRYMQNQDFTVELAESSTDRQLQRAINSGQSNSLEAFDYQIVLLSANYLF